MKMDVHDGLSAVLAAVVDYTITVSQTEFLSDSGYLREDVTYDITVFFVYGVSAAYMLLRDEQDMHRRHGMEIVYSYDTIILINLI
jgi:hypothetical protein